MDADKEFLLDGVRAWLDAIDEDSFQAATEGTEVPNLHALLAELGALKTEVRHESRHIKDALDQFRALFEELQRTNARLQGEIGEQRMREQVCTQEAERGLLLELLELRDRLVDGHAQVAGHRPGWLARKGGAAEFIGGIADGMGMNLRRLDETLVRRQVRPIEAIGQRFDPLIMSAIDTVEDPSQPSNQVMSEVRTGYLRGDTLLRTAEVIVNKHGQGWQDPRAAGDS